MKNSTFYFTGNYRYPKILICTFFVVLVFTNKCSLFSTNSIFYSDNPDLIVSSPDTIPPDTTAIFTEGDTLETYMDGVSIVHILYEDTSAAQDSMEMLLWEFTDNQPHILVEFSDNAAPIQQGMFGFNIGNIFLPGHAYEPEFEEAYGEDPTPFDLLSALRPNVLRFPAGQSATFMQPLGSPFTSDEGNANYGNLNGGYGYDIESVIGYYDMSDGGIDAFEFPKVDMVDLLAQIEDDMYDPIGSCESCIDWIDGDQIKDFEDKYRLWHDQVNFDPTGLDIEEMDELYINDFIRLIEKIEDENPGHVVDVIYCADILSQTASDVVEVIKYLRTNEIYNVNVVGVELGNEVYAEFFAKTVGFTTTTPEDFEEYYEANDFEHYWKYINGDDYTGLDGWSNAELEDAMPDDVETDHDFILKLKDNEDTYDIKIGLPARPHRSCDEFIFIYEDPRDEVLPDPFTEPCPYPQWNIDMTAYYAEEVFSGPADSYLYSFDAVNIHNYITPRSSTFLNSHYRDIILPPDDNCLDGDYMFDKDL